MLVSRGPCACARNFSQSVELMVGVPGVGDHLPNPNSCGGPSFYVKEDFGSFDAHSLYLKFEAKTAFGLEHDQSTSQ